MSPPVPRIPDKRARARRPRFTPEITERILSAVRQGCSIEAAAAAASVARSTLYEWLAKAKEGQSKYEAFAEGLRQAQDQAEAAMVACVARAARGTTDKPGKWKAAAWYLERRHPERWGPTQQVEISGPGGAAIQWENKTHEDLLRDLAAAQALLQATAPTGMLGSGAGPGGGDGGTAEEGED